MDKQSQSFSRKPQSYKEDSNLNSQQYGEDESKRQKAGFFNKNKQNSTQAQSISQQQSQVSANQTNEQQLQTQHQFYAKALESLNSIPLVEQQISKTLEKIISGVRKYDYSISQLYKTVAYSKVRDNLKISHQKTAFTLLGEVTSMLQQQIQQNNSYAIQDLLKLISIYNIENFPEIDKFIQPLLQLLIGLLAIKPSQPQQQQNIEGQQQQQTQSFFFLRLVLTTCLSVLKTVGPKFLKQIEQIFWATYDLFQQQTQLQEFTKQMNNYNFLRNMVCLLRTLNFCLSEMKGSKDLTASSEQQIRAVENIVTRSFKLLFFGNNCTYHTNIFGKRHTALEQQMQETESNQQQWRQQQRQPQPGKKGSINLFSSQNYSSQLSQSSASELSETDEHFQLDSRKYDEQEEKIRNFACLLLHSAIRLYPKILENQWQLMIKSNSFTKEFVKYILKLEQIAFIKSSQQFSSKSIKFQQQSFQSAPTSSRKEENKEQDVFFQQKTSEDCNEKQQKVSDNNSKTQDAVSQSTLQATTSSKIGKQSSDCFGSQETKVKQPNDSELLTTEDQLLENQALVSKENINEMLYPNYMDPSLLGSLVYENNNKIKINIINCLIILLESLPIKQWFIGLDLEKLDKASTTAAQSTKAYQLFQAIKNIHLTLMYCLHTETDIVIVNQILHLYTIIISSTLMFDKIQPDMGVIPLCHNFLLHILTLNQESRSSGNGQAVISYNDSLLKNKGKDKSNNKDKPINDSSAISQQNLLSLKFNAMNCINNLLSLNCNWPSFEELYLKLTLIEDENSQEIVEQNNPSNLFVIVFMTIRQFELEKEFFEQRPDEGLEAVKNILLMEYLGFLIKVQKNYSKSFLQKVKQGEGEKYLLWEQLMHIFFKLQKKFDPEDKKLALLFKIIEEVTRCQNLALQQQQNSEQLDEDDPPIQTTASNSSEVKEGQEQEVSDFQKILYFQFLPQFIINCLQHSNSEILTIGLNIICYIPNNIWQHPNYESKKTQLINNLMQLGEKAQCSGQSQQTKVTLPSSVKLTYFRTLGVLSISSSFNSDQAIVSQILDKIIIYSRVAGIAAGGGQKASDSREDSLNSNIQAPNNLNNIYIKVSWALANWLCNIQVQINTKQINDLFNSLVLFSGFSKEKIASSGLRGLGYFINKTAPEVLIKAICEGGNNQQQNRQTHVVEVGEEGGKEEWNKCLQKMSQIFEKDLKHQSSKVCWNACVALRNIIKSANVEIKITLLKHKPTMDGLLQILRDRNNFKTQIHCINVLLLLKKEDFFEDYYYQFLTTSKQLMQELNSHPYSFAEFKYLQTLREQAVTLFMNLMNFLSKSIKRDVEVFNSITKDSLTLIHEETSTLVINTWRKAKNDEDLITQNDKESIITEQGLVNDEKMKKKVFNLNKTEVNKDKKRNIEELEEEKVKGEESIKKLKFNWKLFEEKSGAAVIVASKEKLGLIQRFSTVICKMIDHCEEFEVSFGMYECFQQLSEIKYEQECFEVTLYNYCEHDEK